MDAIAQLTREHVAAVNLVGEITRAVGSGDHNAAASALVRLRAVLRPHVAVEEDGLFPHLAAEFANGIRTLVLEHTEIDRALEAAPSDGGWEAVLVALGRLRRHIDREENGVFPAALSSLNAVDWEEVDRVRLRVGSAVPADSDADGLAAL